MKYSIVYEIKGKAGAWHQMIAREISEKFGTWKYHEALPPHITIFYPFETSDIQPIKDFLESFTSNTKIPGMFVMFGFDWFPNKAVFTAIETSAPVFTAVHDIRKGVEAIPGISKDLFPIWHPHATVANLLRPEEIHAIHEYTLTLDKPNFVVPFDSVTILQGELDQVRVTVESFSFQN